MIASTVASSAVGFGRLVMMVLTSAESAFASGAISMPARAMARRRTLHGGVRWVQAQCIVASNSPRWQVGNERKEARPMQIGIAGIGKMGAAIALRLIEVGHTITVWNRSPEKVKPIAAAGAAVAATPAELASINDAVITILTNAAAIEAVYGGASGLLAPDVRGKTFHGDEHGRAAHRGRARGQSACEGRRLRRVSGRRFDRSGPAGQADRFDGSRGRRRRARAADPRTALPPARTLRPDRFRLGDEAHHQHAADDLLAGARGGARALPPARARPGADHGPAR